MEYQIISNRGDKTTLYIDDEMTVGDVRGVAAAMLDAPEDRVMTVSLAGKALVNDEETWAELRGRLFPNQQPLPAQRKLFCNLTSRPVTETQSGEVMRMVASKENRKQEQEKERQSTEAMESMVESLAQNPGMLESMLSMNPQIQKMQKKSPEVARMLKDPETLKEILLSSVNPERRKEMERNAQLQLAQISAMPGGQQAINHFMDQMGEDGEEVETENERAIRIGTAAPSETAANLYAPDPARDANNDPLPNPWAAAAPPAASAAPSPYGASPFAGFGSGGAPFGFPPSATPAVGANAGGAPSPFGGQDPAAMAAMWQMMMQANGNPTGSAAAPTASTSPAVLGQAVGAPSSSPSLLSEEALQTGVAALREMGFEDEAMCRAALQATNGDVEAAVDYIADHQED